MSSVSGSFEDFMEQFKKRHADDFSADHGYLKDFQESRDKDRSQSHSSTKLVNEPQKAGSVRLAGVPDRQCQAAGDDFADVWDDTTGEAEVVEE